MFFFAAGRVAVRDRSSCGFRVRTMMQGRGAKWASVRSAVVVSAMTVFAMMLTACEAKSTDPKNPTGDAKTVAMAHGELPAGQPTVGKPTVGKPAIEFEAPPTAVAIAGITWSAPEGWAAGKKSPMRAASYLIPPTKGDVEPAECAVFFFGPGEGGSVEANLTRWKGQFKREVDGKAAEDGSSPEATTTKRAFGDVNVTLLRMEGVFLWKPMPMAPNAVEKPGYAMVGAVVEAPEGPVFFKLTGPRATVAAAEGELSRVLATIRRAG